MAVLPSWPSGDWFDRIMWSAATRVAISATGSAGRGITSALSLGMYVICADHVWHPLQGAFLSSEVASVLYSQVQASVTDFPLAAFATKYVWVWSATQGGANTNGNDAVSGISNAGSGFFWYARVR